MNSSFSQVSIREETRTFPTYEPGEPNPNPMYLEKRVYQGSSGVVYPNPIIDTISPTRTDKEYRVVILENSFIKVMVMPELGGRIHMAYDKKRDYHFVYFNRVIKPALVGLTGPWISGGIEFNWPQHHRPSTFDPVQYRIENHEDGSATLWVGEVERMFRTCTSTGITLRPDFAGIEITGKLYNPTKVPQTFLWWANPAVPVNDQYQSIFPPDVHAVFDHGKRDVSEFPTARGTYYKIDYSEGVDISWYKNIPVPTSYMAYHSDFDFVGGYDHGKQAGILHVADHHVSPGKKMWTWGNGEFAKAWERNLTDEDGPYIELMTGVFTDNQPDFSWIMPGELKEFTQYFMPYAEAPQVCCANRHAVISLQQQGDNGMLDLYSPAQKHLTVTVELNGIPLCTWTREFLPGDHARFSFPIQEDTTLEDCRIRVCADTGEELLTYRQGELKGKPVPESAKAAPKPHEIASIDELYLTGVHLEQYRHATRDPELYYLEGLTRDPGDLRCNTAMGIRRFKSGDLEQARGYLQRAVDRECRWNTNSAHSEAQYYLGLCLLCQNKLLQAESCFGKAAWSKAAAAGSRHYMAVISCRNGEYRKALEQTNQVLAADPQMLQSRMLRCLILEALGCHGESSGELEAVTKLFPLYFPALAEIHKHDWPTLWNTIFRKNAYTLLETALEYRFFGFGSSALQLVNKAVQSLEEAGSSGRGALPLLYYLQGNLLDRAGSSPNKSLKKAEEADYRLCFPNQLEFTEILTWACAAAPEASRAPYYLGCMFYDKGRYEDAHGLWERSAEQDPNFAPVHRALALSFFNKKGCPQEALNSLGKAADLQPEDPRFILELNALMKKTNGDTQKRRDLLETLGEACTQRDDAALEYAAVLNLQGAYRKALDLLMSRQFHPWEGGEGQVPAQYRIAVIGLARQALLAGDLKDAQALLEQALEYPQNLGEGKLPFTPDNEINYYLGWLHESLGSIDTARRYYQKALVGEGTPSLSFFYNDTPAEAHFYRGLAYLRLGESGSAEKIFSSLRDYGLNHLHDEIEIDYFAVSLPDFLVFDDDLTKKNRVFCKFLIGLGCLGLAAAGGGIQKKQQLFIMGKTAFEEALSLDASHSQSAVHLVLSSQMELTAAPGSGV